MNASSVVSQIVAWLAAKAIEARKTTLVIGVSGGIDSAVVSALCALTRLKIIAVSMPVHGKGSPLADTHLQWLQNRYRNVTVYISDIGETVDADIKAYEAVSGKTASGLQKANLMSRTRMKRLYMFADTEGLVVGTGNLVEDYGIGFFTKYGDGGVDLSPIGQLLKSEVRMLGVELGVNQEIINAKPTDGLWEPGSGHATDEEALGMTYDQAETCLHMYDNLVTLAKVFTLEEHLERIEENLKAPYTIYFTWHMATRHKMEMPPICQITRE